MVKYPGPDGSSCIGTGSTSGSVTSSSSAPNFSPVSVYQSMAKTASSSVTISPVILMLRSFHAAPP
jgi:hypothetical protein